MFEKKKIFAIDIYYNSFILTVIVLYQLESLYLSTSPAYKVSQLPQRRQRHQQKFQ